MRIVRRLYLYTVAFVSLEVVVWGVIWLARTIFSTDLAASNAGLLAGGLSLTLVGLPVFLLHWGLAQREANRAPGERSSRIRAIFLYSVLLAYGIPAIHNGLALANRLFLALFGLDYNLALFGPLQTWADNLVAILVPLATAAYFYTILRADWNTVQPRENLIEIRRLQRYIWVIYSLALVVLGVQQLLRFILYVPTGFGLQLGGLMAAGLALLLVGVPLWLWNTQQVEDLLHEPAEQESLLRRFVLYLLALVGLGASLAAAGLVLAALLRWVLGEPNSLAGMLNQLSAPLSIGIPLAAIWRYYGRRLTQEVAQIAESPRRAALRRLYDYILSAAGLVTAFAGLRLLLLYLVNVLLSTALGPDALRGQLASALAATFTGLPLWLIAWRPMQQEAGQSGDAGDHARRSVIRKVYLYLALFAGIIGVMTSAGEAIYPLLRTLLGNRPPDYVVNSLSWLMTLALFSTLTWYHLRVLRGDGRQAGQALAARQGRFPVIVIDADGSDPNAGGFTQDFLDALQRQAPAIPLALVRLSQGIPAEGLASASAVVLPAALATDPPEALRLWLEQFQGQKLVVPLPSEGWQWLGHSSGKDETSEQHELAEQAALAIRQLSEGQPVRLTLPMSPWMVVGIIFAVLFALELVLLAVSLIASRF